MIERLYMPCPCTLDEKPGWEFVESDHDYWRPCTDCNGLLKIKESDSDFNARLQSIIEQQERTISAYKRLAKRWMKRAKWLADDCTYPHGVGKKARIAARLKAAKKATGGKE